MESSLPGWKALQNSKQNNSRSPHRPRPAPLGAPGRGTVLGRGQVCLQGQQGAGHPHTCPHLCQPEA